MTGFLVNAISSLVLLYEIILVLSLLL